MQHSFSHLVSLCRQVVVSSSPESCEVGEIGGADAARASRRGSSIAAAASRTAIAPSVRESWGVVPLMDLEGKRERGRRDEKQRRREA